MNKLPIAELVENITNYLVENTTGLFEVLNNIGNNLVGGLEGVLISIPPILFLVVIASLAFYVKRKQKKFGFGIFVIIGLGLVINQELWPEFISTLSIVLLSSALAVIIGVPLGILAGKSDIADVIIKPILDFMQTMPSFVYLIPAVAFFGIGVVPGIVASIIFALPPTVRFTSLGIRQVPEEIVEASISFGATSWQRLMGVELPLAVPTIFAGINQTIMLSLSMVVVASMIGAPGLGRVIISALQRTQVGEGFVAGLGVVVLAIIIDRFSQVLEARYNE